MRAVSLHQLILLIFTAVSLPSLLDALPQNLAPNTVELEVRRPPPKAAPGCPTARFLHAQTREFLGNFYDPSIPKQYAAFGGYDGFTKDKLWYNFTIKDITPNYPAAEKGKKIPPLGRWAKSRRQFADKLNVEMPKIFKVLGNIHYDENKVWYGGTLDDNDCLTGFWKGTYIATLKEAYGYVDSSSSSSSKMITHGLLNSLCGGGTTSKFPVTMTDIFPFVQLEARKRVQRSTGNTTILSK